MSLGETPGAEAKASCHLTSDNFSAAPGSVDCASWVVNRSVEISLQLGGTVKYTPSDLDAAYFCDVPPHPVTNSATLKVKERIRKRYVNHFSNLGAGVSIPVSFR